MADNKHIVPDNVKRQYLNEYLPKAFRIYVSRGRAKKAIQKGEVIVNGEKVRSDYIVSPGDQLEIVSTAPKNKKIFRQDLDVVYEDDHMAVINKPGGLPVNGNTFKTLENALPHNLKRSKSGDPLPYPLPVHRLDVPTCGLVMVAKTISAQIKLGTALQNKELTKQYNAVVIGSFKDKKGRIENPIKGKSCITDYEVLLETKSAKYGQLTFVRLFPVTGRTHQLRIHLSELGHPIVGDEYYANGTELLKGKGLFLSAVQLNLKHPITNKDLEVKIIPPRKFNKYMEREEFMANK